MASEAPTALVVSPDGHASQLVASVVVLYVPIAHWLQTSPLALSIKLPAGQTIVGKNIKMSHNYLSLFVRLVTC